MAGTRYVVGIVAAWLLLAVSPYAFEVSVRFQDAINDPVIPDSTVVTITNSKGYRVASNLFVSDPNPVLVFSGIPGDYQIDGRPEESFVNFADFIYFVKSYSHRETVPDWDFFNIDGRDGIQFQDFILFVNMFGNTVASLPQRDLFTVNVRTVHGASADTLSRDVALDFGKSISLLERIGTSAVFAESLTVVLSDSSVAYGDTVTVGAVKTLYRDMLPVRVDSLADSLFSVVVTTTLGDTVSADTSRFIALHADTLFVRVSADTLSALDTLLVGPAPDTIAAIVSSFVVSKDHARIDSLFFSERVLLTISVNADTLWGPDSITTLSGLPIGSLHEGTNLIRILAIDSSGNVTDTTFTVVEPDASGPEILGIAPGVYGTMDGSRLEFDFSLADSLSGLKRIDISHDAGQVTFFSRDYSGEDSARVSISHDFGVVSSETQRIMLIRAWDRAGFQTTVLDTFYQAAQDNGTTTGGEDPPPPPPPPSPSPQPSLNSLSGPSTLSQGQSGTFTASASNATRIEWYVDGSQTGATGSSYSFSSTSVGNHTITARAVNDSGSDTKTADKSVTVFVGGGAP